MGGTQNPCWVTGGAGNLAQSAEASGLRACRSQMWSCIHIYTYITPPLTPPHRPGPPSRFKSETVMAILSPARTSFWWNRTTFWSTRTMFWSARTSFWHEKNKLLVRNWSDFIAQTFEYHFFDQRFALVLLERVPVLPNHGIQCFLLILCGLWSKIAPEKASPADGLSRRNIGQIEHRGVRWEQIMDIHSA